MQRPQDPIAPRLTFDSYVIPETVTEDRRPAPAFRISGMMVAVSLIAVLTFTLGVMATLKFARPAQEVAALAPQATAPALPAAPPAEAQSVTRQRTPDLTSTQQAAALATPAAPAMVPDLEAAVLKGLQPIRTVGKLTKDEMAQRALEAQAIVNRNKLRMLREGVMAGVYTVKAHKENGINRLVLTTVNAEMTRNNMANLLREAAERGEIVIPTSLSTAEGDVDMDTMLFNLIQTSLMNDGTLEGAEAAREMSRRAFAASDAKSTEVKGKRTYVVQPGDSLAYISLQFYGRPNAYNRIFEANRETLKSPDLIRIGQRLIIPG